ncbi:hypothetical protein [Sphingomonas melonis]|uniref:hypothetical protein n=1 Tax=Sphingomonas melonis TaxID=152682 RepID=UPI0035C86B41
MYNSPFGGDDLKLPAAPTSFAPEAPKLPAAPPRSASPFDKEHRRETFLGLAQAFGSGFNFGDGLANAAGVLGQRYGDIRKETRQQHEFGGPDDTFDIQTDPRTGERTVTAIPQFQQYLAEKRVKPADRADMNGRAMFALQQLPPEQRAAAYASMRQNPGQYGIDPASMPAEYDPNYAAMAAGMGMTVSQAMTRRQADDRADATADYRAQVQADRTRRTGIYESRAAATTAQ